MSQQTQISRVITKFIERVEVYPTLEDLADSSTEQLLRMRSGLGFNSRALRLREAAKTIMQNYNGEIPSSRKDLFALPGVGPYTSAAICAFAFNQDVPVVDTNIRRIFVSEMGVDSSFSLVQLEPYVLQTIPSGRANDRFNALMDYGALVATSKKTGIGSLNKQSPFKGSNREVRGRILKQLSQKKTVTIDILLKMFPKKDIPMIVLGLEKEDLITHGVAGVISFPTD